LVFSSHLQNKLSIMGFAQEVANFPREIGKAFALNRKQALVFLTCWWCWTLGSMNFYLLPYTQPAVAKTLGVETSKIAEANTTTMLSRAIGAAIFGVLSDQYGRKIPLVVDLILMGVFTLSSGFVHTYGQFVAVRFLFGEYSLAAVYHTIGCVNRASRYYLWRFVRC
jgi:SHS family lactate transporter-like MFS transporter